MTEDASVIGQRKLIDSDSALKPQLFKRSGLLMKWHHFLYPTLTEYQNDGMQLGQ